MNKSGSKMGARDGDSWEWVEKISYCSPAVEPGTEAALQASTGVPSSRQIGYLWDVQFMQ